jgi:hypothetical protein
LGVGDHLITSFSTQLETISVNESDIGNANKAKNHLQIWRLQETAKQNFSGNENFSTE